MTRPSLHLADALGHDTSDKRLDILRRVGEAGSISEAARLCGVSYKAAWQAVETLSNLAGAPLLERAVGGAGGGGARLTAAGEQLLAAAQRLQAARAQVLRELASPGAPLLGAVGLRTSLRNQLPCQVLGLTRQAGTVRVRLGLSDGQTLASAITRESAELLGLHPGLPVLALCKATAVQLRAHAQQPAPGPAHNLLQGQVTRGAPAVRGGQASLALPGGLQLVGLCPPGAGLRRGHAAWASFEPSAVVIALAG